MRFGLFGKTTICSGSETGADIIYSARVPENAKKAKLLEDLSPCYQRYSSGRYTTHCSISSTVTVAERLMAW